MVKKLILATTLFFFAKSICMEEKSNTVIDVKSPQAFPILELPAEILTMIIEAFTDEGQDFFHIEFPGFISRVKNKHIGPSFDELLKAEGTLEAVELAAIKKVIAEQITKEMKKKKISQTEMARRLGTSRAALMRLLNPENYSVTLLTLYRAASALGKDLEIRFQ